MNDNAQKWIEGLRSGEFEQTEGRLRRRNSFCCLGVACEVYRRETGEGEWSERGDFRVGDENVDLGLPKAVKEWYGLRERIQASTRGDEVYYRSGGKQEEREALTFKNDEGATFDQIAEIIESEPEGLFA